MGFRPIACCCGRRETRACWRTLSSSSAIRRRRNGHGSDITSSALLWTPRVAGIVRFVCILVKLRNGHRAGLATCADTKSNGFARLLRSRVRSGAQSVPRRNVRLQLLRRLLSRLRERRTRVPAKKTSCRRAHRWCRRARRAQAGGDRRRKRDASGVAAGATPGVNPELREYIREWRRVTSKKLNIAAFIIMHDTSLDHLCQVQPRSLAEIRKVSGFGERKTEMYGPDILEALERFRNGERIVADLPRVDATDSGE